MTISEWKKDFVDYLNLLNIPRDDYKGIISYIDEIPTVEAEPVRHGKWIFGNTLGHSWMKCSECCVSQDGQTSCFSYCPNCGAKMDGKREER